MTPFRSSLDWLNFFLADVRGGLGPYVNAFLVTEGGWSSEQIGAALTFSGLLGLCVHPMIGAYIDATARKRELLTIGTWLLAACGVGVALSQSAAMVIATDVAMASLGALFAPIVAALTLGLVGYGALAAQTARNAAFDKIGNLFIAALAALVGALAGQKAIFFLPAAFAIAVTYVTFRIPAAAIDQSIARGLSEKPQSRRVAALWRELLQHRPFLALTASVGLFHFASAPMLFLATQSLALSAPGYETVVTSAAVAASQLATIPVALMIGRVRLERLILIVCCAVPVRGALLACVEAPELIILIQCLDGVGAGLLDALLPVALARAVYGLGRYSSARGVLGTVQGVGGTTSYIAAGALATHFGYPMAFAFFACVAAVAAVMMMLSVRLWVCQEQELIQ